MAKGPKGFTAPEKRQLRKKLREACEKSWALYGYKKTSVSDLTKTVGISTGAFYLLYHTKEDVFCDTLEHIQHRLKTTIRNMVAHQKGKAGFLASIKWQFEEYQRFPFLYDFSAPDFLAFLNKLPQERVKKLQFDSLSFFYEIIERTNLQLKVSEKKAYAIISTLLYTVTIKDKLSYDSFEVFDFLLESTIDRLAVETPTN